MSAPRDPRRRPHESFDELAVGWALHALEPEDEQRFAAHLPTCLRCGQTVAETTDVMAAMAGDLPPVAPPERLRHRLRAAVAETEQVAPPAAGVARTARPARAGDRAAPPAQEGDRTAPPAPLPVPVDRPAAAHRSAALPSGAHRAQPLGGGGHGAGWHRVLPNALVAAAVVAILALGTWNVAISTSREDAQATAAERAEVVEALLAPGRATVAPLTAGGAAVATVVVRDDQVQVVTQDLAANDVREQTYVMWGTGAGAPVPLGTFDVTSPHPSVWTVGWGASGLADYTGFAVSLEPGRSAPPEPGDIVAAGEVPS